MLPFRVSEATPLDKGTTASESFPTEKLTLPVGAALPVADLTVAVNRVDPVAAMLVGFAVTVVMVATGGAVTLTVADPDELAKFPVGI